jgi:hypothetical protein
MPGKTIAKVYYDPLKGFQNLGRTLEAVRKIDKSIKREDVKQFLERQEETQFRPQTKQNSFVPQQAGHQLQFDLAFASHFPRKSFLQIRTARYRQFLQTASGDTPKNKNG